MQHSIRNRLMVAFISLAVGPLLLVGLALAWWSITDQERQTLNLQRQTARRVATEVQTFIEGQEEALEIVTMVKGLLGLDPDQQRILLSGLQSLNQVFETLVLLDSDGRERAHVSRLGVSAAELGNRSEADEFVIPKSTNETYFGPVWVDETTREPLMTIAVPLFDARSGSVEGVLVADIRLKKIWDLLGAMRLGEGETVYVANEQGIVVAHREPSVVLQRAQIALPDQDGFSPGLAGSNAVLVVDQIPLGQQEFFVVAEKTMFEAFRPALNTVIVIIGVIIIAVAAAYIIAMQTLNRIVRPIQSMATTAEAISAGDLSLQVDINSQDELGTLATGFNNMTRQLRHLIGSLEDQVRERTAELSTSMEVGQRAASIREFAELLTTITDFIRERFHLYYVQIYFVDDIGEKLVLKAGTGQVGQALLTRRHSLSVGGQSIVGQVAQGRQPIVVPDTTESDIHQPNELLPETRSELAVPLTVEGKVIGVLDMQASEPDTFTVNNMTVFEAMATQIAISIDSARQWTLAQEAQRRAEQAAGQLVREGWVDALAVKKQGRLGFAYDLSSVSPLESEADTNGNGLSAPVLVQNQPIGRLSVDIPVSRTWSDDERVLVEAVAQQVAQKAETLRLFEVTRQRAAREQLARQIVDKVRASRDIETAMETAAEELTRALGVAKAVIDLKVTRSDDEESAKVTADTENKPDSAVDESGIGQNGA